MVGTTQQQLNEANKNVPGFLGAFAADQLPKNPQRPFSLIVNYSKADSPSGGTHWVAMKFPAYSNALYFDSYGKMPDNFDNLLSTDTHFGEYLAKHSYTGYFDYNHIDLQCYGPSDVCGEWSSMFVRIGVIPKRGHNGNEWDKLLAKRTTRDRTGYELFGHQTSSCDRRDSAVFKAADIRRRRAHGYPL